MSSTVYFLLFDDFETLDTFGPVEVFGQIEQYKLVYCSLKGGFIKSKQGTIISTEKVERLDANSILVVPGGLGTRTLVNDEEFISSLKKLAQDAKYVLTVCTGSALLAKTGLIKGTRATSNKKAYKWVVSIDNQVRWIHEARWVVDGKFYTASGVSAGIDMSIGFVSDIFGRDKAIEMCKHIEYIWHSNKDEDPFVSNTQ